MYQNTIPVLVHETTHRQKITNNTSTIEVRKMWLEQSCSWSTFERQNRVHLPVVFGWQYYTLLDHNTITSAWDLRILKTFLLNPKKHLLFRASIEHHIKMSFGFHLLTVSNRLLFLYFYMTDLQKSFWTSYFISPPDLFW